MQQFKKIKLFARKKKKKKKAYYEHIIGNQYKLHFGLLTPHR